MTTPPEGTWSGDRGELLRVALDTTFAGVNPTGVGLYSGRLASALNAQASALGLQIRCYGPSCDAERTAHPLLATAQEWPISTHGILPLRLLRNKPTITHSTSHIGPVWGPGKLVVTVHDLIFTRYPEDYNPLWLLITRLTLPAVLRRARVVIADSHTTKSDIVHFYRVRPGKIVVVYPGVDDTYRPARVDAAEKPYILCLGPWVRRKNLDTVVRAFQQLTHKLPDLTLVITGKPSSGMRGYTEAELLEHLSAETRLRVKLTGYVAKAELPRLVAKASVLAYPSRWEGFGLPPLEAMSAGVPVVASRTPAVEEVTAGTAHLCDPDSPDEWSSAFERILRDPDYAKRLVEDGIRRSAAFTWERCAAHTAHVYHQVASHSGSDGKRWV